MQCTVLVIIEYLQLSESVMEPLHLTLLNGQQLTVLNINVEVCYKEACDTKASFPPGLSQFSYFWFLVHEPEHSNINNGQNYSYIKLL